IGVPKEVKLGGLDALFSIVQMPPGIPVATVGIDNWKNAAILAIEILALKYPGFADRLLEERKKK
ncbi:MAG: AIR carboxylase family protein, partial [Crenarchaeota archaeon]|nr:AIR carboxylase family protein [Thermoproteota archaeon]MDW8034614.1 AIR carboxylase family protein [Nitrososphaerota archaeon]